jgi:hypothetical protein
MVEEIPEGEDPPPAFPPIAAVITKSAMIATHPNAAILVRATFAPHFGQASALVLISVPHSLQHVIAMRFCSSEMYRKFTTSGARPTPSSAAAYVARSALFGSGDSVLLHVSPPLQK